VENGAPTASSAHPENGAVSPSWIGVIVGTGGAMSRSGVGSTVGGDQRGIPGDGIGAIRGLGETPIFCASSCVNGL
jgi:hypothetical protein